MLPLLNACIRTFTTSMGFVVAVAHATEMPDTNIGSAKEYAEEEEEEEDDNDVKEFSRRSRSLLICSSVSKMEESQSPLLHIYNI